MRSSTLILGLAALAAGLDEDSEDVSLLQVSASAYPQSQEATNFTNQAAANWADHVMGQMEDQWTTGFWAQTDFFAQTDNEPGCGRSTFQELQVTIPKWQQRNPGVNGFCHFQNHAFWFGGASHKQYRAVGKGSGLHQGTGSLLCDSSGEVGNGPAMAFSYDAGEISWTSMRNCIDIVDDPYCYSLGWLKGQGGWDESLMDNVTAWEQLAREQCDKLQAEFHFDDEEVTVGRHVFSTPLYFRRTWNSLRGRGMPIDKRFHAEHVYTKCQLGHGGAPGEMAYCYFKGCVLPDGKIGHFEECNYDP